MIAPRLPIRYRNVDYVLTQLGEAWVIDVAGGKYFLTAGGDPREAAYRFLRGLPKNSIYPRTPAYLATELHPLLLEIDGEIVRAWPAYVPRENPSTYVHPYRGDRVLATEDKPRWMFAARGRETSPSEEANGEQPREDVEQLARQWLRSPRSEND